MAKEKSSGCLIVAIILLVLVALLAVPVGLWFYRAKSVRMQERDAMHAEVTAMEARNGIYASDEGAVILQAKELQSFTVPKAGEEITRERLVVFLNSNTATELSKETFRKVASGAKVKWLLRTNNVVDNNGTLQGDFSMPWQIQTRNGSSGSEVRIDAEFTEESREALLNLRRRAWVPVEGELSFNGDTPVLKNARLASEPLGTGR